VTEPLVPEVVEQPIKVLRKKKGGGFMISHQPRKPGPEPKGESLVQAQCFEHYYALGEKRTFNAVSDKFKKSTSALAEWSMKFGWKDRIMARDKEVASRLRYETEEQTIERRKNVLAIIDYCIANKLEKDTEGKIIGVKGIDFKSVAELQAFIDLAEKILNPGAVTSGAKVTAGSQGQQQGQKIIINIEK
jgi:hypothetical protein